MKHLLVDISAHGFGHIAQTAAVLNALDATDIRLSIRSMASREVLKERIKHPFELIPYQQDKGMLMLNALQVNAKATMNWYREFHANYVQRLQKAVGDLNDLQPDLLFSDIPYLSLEAATKANIPTIALCSLNWADIFLAYCQHFDGADAIYQQILHAYSQADIFLQPVPSIPMEPLNNTQAIAPIALHGNKHSSLAAISAKVKDSRFILVALGGIDMQYPLEQWSSIENVYWIFDDESLYLQRDDFIPKSAFNLSYIDLLSSCDVILTKTGYGTQAEAVVNQIPTLCVSRGDWPEEPHLFAWHGQNGIVEFISWKAIENGNFQQTISRLLNAKWNKAKVSPTGASEAAQLIQQRLY